MWYLAGFYSLNFPIYVFSIQNGWILKSRFSIFSDYDNFLLSVNYETANIKLCLTLFNV